MPGRTRPHRHAIRFRAHLKLPQLGLEGPLLGANRFIAACSVTALLRSAPKEMLVAVGSGLLTR